MYWTPACAGVTVFKRACPALNLFPSELNTPNYKYVLSAP